MIIQGKNIHLHPAALEDRRMVWEWLECSDITPIVQSHDGPQSFDQFCNDDWVEHYFMDVSSELGRGFLIIHNEVPIGFVAYNDIMSTPRRTELDIWMTSENNCNKGYGPDALRTLCAYLYSDLQVHDIYIQPSARNQRAVRAYEKAGFHRVSATAEEIEKLLGSADHSDSVLMKHNANT